MTIIGFGFGSLFMVVGALLLIGAALRSRNRERDQEYRQDAPPPRSGDVSNSMFGR
jgi:hypothetical protein